MEKSEYKSLGEWRKADFNAYSTATKLGMIDELCEFFGWTRKYEISKNIKVGHWDVKENCKKVAKKCNTRKELYNDYPSTYKSITKNGWYDELCGHFVVIRNRRNHWSLESCKQDALKYKTKKEWRKESNGASMAAYKNGWFDECTAHMNEIIKSKGYWNKEKCLESALKCKTKMEFKTKYPTGYGNARKNGWLVECSKHMS